MAFDFTAIMLGFLGTSFLMFYSSNIINGIFGEESPIQRFMLPLKIFFFMMGIFMVFLALSFNQQIMDSTITTNHDADGYPTEAMQGNMSVQTTTGLTVMTYTLWGVSAWLVLGFFVLMLLLLIGFAFGKKDRGGEVL